MASRNPAVIVLGLLLATGAACAGEGGKLTLTVKETAGIRRFGYPVHAELSLPRAATQKDRFRLLADGKPVAAQFRPAGSAVALDFNINLGPFEKQTYTVEYGPKTEAGPEPRAGLTLEEDRDTFTVRSGGLAYVVPRDLKGLLREVRSGKSPYTRPGSVGLVLRTEKGPVVVGGPSAKARVLRQGPLTVALHFESEVELPGKGKLNSLVTMTFPRSKSWIEVRWLVKSSGIAAQEMEVDLNLLAETSPTLVDFGAGSAVYTTLTKGQTALLRAGSGPGPSWEVLTGCGDDLRSFVRANPARPTVPEGWAHVMDRQRCTAVAIDAFARHFIDEIRIDADGRLRLRRSTGFRPAIQEPLRFWLHFVSMPVQVGAVTSPQSMQAPLVVEVK